MRRNRIRTWVFALALGLCAGAGAQIGAPLLGNESPQNSLSLQNNAYAASNAFAQNNTPAETREALTAARVGESAEVIILAPILRNTGKTSITSDRPLLGRLNLQRQQRPLREQPPAMPPVPNETAPSGALGAPEREPA
jgi:hypothetical protein